MSLIFIRRYGSAACKWQVLTSTLCFEIWREVVSSKSVDLLAILKEFNWRICHPFPGKWRYFLAPVNRFYFYRWLDTAEFLVLGGLPKINSQNKAQSRYIKLNRPCTCDTTVITQVIDKSKRFHAFTLWVYRTPHVNSMNIQFMP